MSKRNIFLAVMVVALILVILSAVPLKQEAKASAAEKSLNSSLIEELNQRVAALEADQKLQKKADQDKEETSGQPDYTEQFNKMAAALEKMAEKSDKLDDISASMEKIVERLTNIEEELAWSRIDDEEEAEQD